MEWSRSRQNKKVENGKAKLSISKQKSLIGLTIFKAQKRALRLLVHFFKMNMSRDGIIGSLYDNFHYL